MTQPTGAPSGDAQAESVRALRAAIEREVAVAGGATTPGMSVADLPIKCVAAAIIQYGRCKLTRGEKCELKAIRDILNCFIG